MGGGRHSHGDMFASTVVPRLYAVAGAILQLRANEGARRRWLGLSPLDQWACLEAATGAALEGGGLGLGLDFIVPQQHAHYHQCCRDQVERALRASTAHGHTAGQPAGHAMDLSGDHSVDRSVDRSVGLTVGLTVDHAVDLTGRDGLGSLAAGGPSLRSAALGCPHCGSDLAAFRAPHGYEHGTFACDGCGQPAAVAALLRGCRPCDFDLCADCAAASSVATT